MPSTKSSREPARRDTFCRQATPRETSRRETVAQHAPPHPFAPLPGWSATTSHERLLSLANGLGRTISVARALVSAGRTVDLSGFQESVGAH